MIKKIIICILSIAVITLSLLLYYEKEDKRYISKISEKDNISMLKIVGEETEVIKQVPQTGQWVMSYTCDDENAELYWNEKKRTVVAKNISATECTLIFRESDAIFRMISMYVDGEYVTELDSTKKYEMESYECTNGEELTWDIETNKLSIEPILEDTSCYVIFNEKIIPPTLTEKILADNTTQSDAGISFGSTSAADGTNGLYYTSDTSKTENGEVVYYYRGAVANNYLVFANYCWRIVRTVEDGSVRLRYGGSPTQNGETHICPQTGTAVNIASSQAYNTSYGDKSYVNYKTSSIRTTVENWYEDNIYYKADGITENTALTSLVADTPYCNDMSERVSGSNIYFGAYDRLHSSGTNKYNPQYKCANSTYGYTVAKGDLTYPVGLLTADEVAYAGGVLFQSNSSYYLNTGELYWTMSPSYIYSSYSDVFGVTSGGNLYSGVNGANAVVPVVSLKPEATVKRGTGAYNDPYVINTD